jgi:hypothetical protein
VDLGLALALLAQCGVRGARCLGAPVGVGGDLDLLARRLQLALQLLDARGVGGCRRGLLVRRVQVLARRGRLGACRVELVGQPLAQRLELALGALALGVDRRRRPLALRLDLLDALVTLGFERLLVVRPQRGERLLCAGALGTERLLGGGLRGGQRALVLELQRREGVLELTLVCRLGLFAVRFELRSGLVARDERQRELLAQPRQLALTRLVGWRRLGRRRVGRLSRSCLRSVAAVGRHDDGAHGFACTLGGLHHE